MQTVKLMLIAVSVIGLGTVLNASGARAGLACFDGPHLDHEDKAYAYWQYTNNCNSSIIINYQIKSLNGDIETGTTSIGACRDGSLIDLKGEYHFDIKGADKGKSDPCASKTEAGDSDASDEGQSQNNTVYSAHPSRVPNRAAAAPEDTVSGSDDPAHQDLDAEYGAGDQQGRIERFTHRFGTASGPDRCWRQKAARAALLICCDSKRLCEDTCIEATKKSMANACGSACAGAAEYAPAGMNCYWAH